MSLSTSMSCFWYLRCLFFFFFNDTATTEIYTLSLHDALPISRSSGGVWLAGPQFAVQRGANWGDRKSTRLNSSHANISYAVFCLKKKKIALHLRMRLTECEELTSQSQDYQSSFATDAATAVHA